MRMAVDGLAPPWGTVQNSTGGSTHHPGTEHPVVGMMVVVVVVVMVDSRASTRVRSPLVAAVRVIEQ